MAPARSHLITKTKLRWWMVEIRDDAPPSCHLWLKWRSNTNSWRIWWLLATNFSNSNKNQIVKPYGSSSNSSWTKGRQYRRKQNAAFESLANLAIIEDGIKIIKVYFFVFKKFDRSVILLEPFIVPDLCNSYPLHRTEKNFSGTTRTKLTRPKPSITDRHFY